MSEYVARLHFQPAGPAAGARVVAGWLIALTGCALLLAQLMRGLDPFPELGSALQTALRSGMVAAAATALGAAPLLLARRVRTSVQDSLLGFGAGVMLAASVFSLLLPAVAAAQDNGATQSMATAQALLALALGAAALLAADRLLPHQHTPEDRRNPAAAWLFVVAIALHNLPEGLAIGVAATLDSTAVAHGIAIQNLPEGLIVASVLVSAGYRRGFALALAAVSGLVEPMAAIVGALMASASSAILPWALGSAAGAMLFVVSHEIIPESHRRGHETLATAGLIAGFAAMMWMDSMLA